MRLLRLAFSPRFIVYTLCVLATAALLATVLAYPPAFEVAAVPLLASLGLSALGTYDRFQARHALRRGQIRERNTGDMGCSRRKASP